MKEFRSLRNACGQTLARSPPRNGRGKHTNLSRQYRHLARKVTGERYFDDSDTETESERPSVWFARALKEEVEKQEAREKQIELRTAFGLAEKDGRHDESCDGAGAANMSFLKPHPSPKPSALVPSPSPEPEFKLDRWLQETEGSCRGRSEKTATARKSRPQLQLSTTTPHLCQPVGLELGTDWSRRPTTSGGRMESQARTPTLAPVDRGRTPEASPMLSPIPSPLSVRETRRRGRREAIYTPRGTSPSPSVWESRSIMTLGEQEQPAETGSVELAGINQLNELLNEIERTESR